jgi:DNA-binding MarR family transcriptional regulator
MALGSKEKAQEKPRAAMVRQDASRLADFIMFTQRSFLLNLSKEINKGHISFSQFFLLGYLAKEEFLTMSDISKKMGHSTAAATGLVDRLEKLGYVQRLQASDDRRKVIVQARRKGIEFVERMREEIIESLAVLMDDLDRDEQVSVLEAQAKLTEPAEEDLVETITTGQPKEFWVEYHALKKRAEETKLSDEEAERLISMATEIEEADADRLAAAADLARLRGVSFDHIVAEYEIGVAVG